MAVVAICDANILIDYSKSDISVISKINEKVLSEFMDKLAQI